MTSSRKSAWRSAIFAALIVTYCWAGISVGHLSVVARAQDGQLRASQSLRLVEYCRNLCSRPSLIVFSRADPPIGWQQAELLQSAVAALDIAHTVEIIVVLDSLFVDQQVYSDLRVVLDPVYYEDGAPGLASLPGIVLFDPCQRSRNSPRLNHVIPTMTIT